MNFKAMIAQYTYALNIACFIYETKFYLKITRVS